MITRAARRPERERPSCHARSFTESPPAPPDGGGGGGKGRAAPPSPWFPRLDPPLPRRPLQIRNPQGGKPIPPRASYSARFARRARGAPGGGSRAPRAPVRPEPDTARVESGSGHALCRSVLAVVPVRPPQEGLPWVPSFVVPGERRHSVAAPRLSNTHSGARRRRPARRRGDRRVGARGVAQASPIGPATFEGDRPTHVSLTCHAGGGSACPFG